MTAASFLAGFALALGGIGAQEGGTAPAERVAALAAEHRRSGEATVEALAAAMVELGPASIPALVDALRERRAGPIPLGEDGAAAALRALDRFGRAAFLPCLRERARGASAGDRAVAIEVLGHAGAWGDLALMLEAAALEPGALGPDPRVARALEQGLARLLARDPGAVRAARGMIVSAPEHAVAPLARAVACSGSPLAFEVLADGLGYRDSLDAVLLAWLARAPGCEPGEIGAAVGVSLRGHIEGEDPTLARVAAIAAGELEDSGSVAHLIGRLEDPDRGLREAAHWSLQRISGLGFPPERARWATWHRLEERWLRTERPRAVADLGSPHGDLVLRTLGEIAQHRLDRHRLASEVAGVLEHPDPAVRRIACGVLAQLRSPRALAALEERAADADPSVAQEAGRALRAIGRVEPAASLSRTP